jgi:hypothetical protein
MRLRALGIVAVSIGISVSVLAQGPRRDGKWEVKMEMSMPGMPQPMPPITTTQCITKEEAADPMKSVPQGPPGRGGRGMPDNCKMSNYKMDGNKVTFSMTCDPPQAMTMTAEFIYGVDTYDGTMKVDSDRGGQPMAMTMKYSGKRLGDCTK